MVLETLVVVVEVVLVGMATLVVEGTSVGEVALVAVKVVVEAIVIWAITTINPQILDPWKEEILEAEALAPMVVEANIWPNNKTKVVVAVPAAAVAMEVAEGFNYCQETKLSRRGEPEK